MDEKTPNTVEAKEHKELTKTVLAVCSQNGQQAQLLLFWKKSILIVKIYNTRRIENIPRQLRACVKHPILNGETHWIV